MASRHFSFKTGKAGAGSKHAEYIAGVGKYIDRDDVRHLSDHNMPGWAVDGRDFFAAADALERANGRSYSEIEFAIPRECTDPVQYAKDYSAKLLGDRHPYRLAVHDKLARDGGRNVHGHLMVTERRLDGIERDRDQFFKRANAKHPERGGTAKDRQWNERQHIDSLRRGYEGHAKAHGIALDLRSNLAQGLTRPEPKIGPQRKRSKPDLVRADRQTEVDKIRINRKVMAMAKTELTSIEKEQRNERIKQRRAAHRQYAARTEAPRIDRVPRMHERRHYGDAPRAQHLLPGNAFDRLGERQAAERAYRVQLENDRAARVAKQQAAIKATAAQERNRREGRRGAWQAKHLRTPGVAPRAGVTPSPGKPRYWEYSDGPAKGFAAVVDYGDRIKPTGNLAKLSDHKVAALLEVAKAKGWTAITVTGDEAFRQRVAVAATRAGLGLLDADLKAHAAHAEQERVNAQMKEQQAAKERAAPAPSPSKPLPTAKPSQFMERTAASADAFRAKLDEIQKRLESGVPPAPAPAAKTQADIEWARQDKAERDRLKAQLAKRQTARHPAASSLSEPSPAAQPLTAAQQPARAETPKEYAQRLVREAEAKQAAALQTAKNPAPGVALIENVMREHDEVNKAVVALERQHREVAPYPDTHLKSGWERAAMAEALAKVDTAWKAANPPAPGAPHWANDPQQWSWARDVVAGQLKGHLETPRPLLFSGKYDQQTHALQASVAAWESRLKERNDKAMKIAPALYDQKAAEHQRREAGKVAEQQKIEQKLKPLRERREALAAELKARDPEVKAIYKAREQERQQAHGLSKGRGISR